jgi:hypothetical protein
MYTEPMIFPLDLEGKIYLLQDENGETIGTGSRKVCEDLRSMISRSRTISAEGDYSQISCKTNVRSVIAI